MKKKKPSTKKPLRELKTIISNWMTEDGLAAEVDTTAWAIYTILAEHARWESGLAFPSFKTIMKKLGIKREETVAMAIDKLQKAGLIDYEYRRSVDAEGKAFGIGHHTYTLIYPANLKEIPPKPEQQS